MLLMLRDYVYKSPWQILEVETLRRRILKIGTRVRETNRRIWIHVSSAYPEQEIIWCIASIAPDVATTSCSRILILDLSVEAVSLENTLLQLLLPSGIRSEGSTPDPTLGNLRSRRKSRFFVRFVNNCG